MTQTNLHYIFVLICLLVGTWATEAEAQDPVYSQYYAAPLQLNPAFTGNTIAPFITLNYRNDWTSIPTAYQTYSVSYSQFFEDANSGFGLTASADDAGEGLYKINRFTGLFAYKLQVNRDISLKMGIEAGLIQTAIDWNRYLFTEQVGQDGSISESTEIRPDDFNRTMLDISTGLLVYSSRFYGGVSLFHINTPSDSYLPVNENLNAGFPMRVSVHGGMQLPLTNGSSRGPEAFVSPNILYTQQRDHAQINVGAYAGYGAVFGGLWLRQTGTNPDAVIFLAGVQKGVVKIGYSYDMTISSALNTRTGGGHEISVILNFDDGRQRFDYNDCLNMFR